MCVWVGGGGGGWGAPLPKLFTSLVKIGSINGNSLDASEKKTYSKRKEFASDWSKLFFLFFIYLLLFSC